MTQVKEFYKMAQKNHILHHNKASKIPIYQKSTNLAAMKNPGNENYLNLSTNKFKFFRK